jgi:hypothetical protein
LVRQRAFCAQLGYGGFRHQMPAQARDVAPKETAAGDKTAFGEADKPSVCAVAHSDIVDMQDRGALDVEGAGQSHAQVSMAIHVTESRGCAGSVTGRLGDWGNSLGSATEVNLAEPDSGLTRLSLWED